MEKIINQDLFTGNSNMQENDKSYDEILAKLSPSQAEAAMAIFSEIFPQEINSKHCKQIPGSVRSLVSCILLLII